jgi:cell division protein FtsL
MRRALVLALVASVPILLIGTVWQTSRYTALAEEAEALESSQEEWVEQNKAIMGSIAVVSRREQIADWAEKLGLEKAKPEQRLRIVPPAKAGVKGSSGGGQNG